MTPSLAAWLPFAGSIIVAAVAGVLAKKPQDRSIALEEMKAALAWQHDEIAGQKIEIADLRQRVAECHAREVKTNARLAELETVIRRVGTRRMEGDADA